MDSGHVDPKKGSVGKDRSQARHNPHIHVDLPDLNTELAKEDAIHQHLMERVASGDQRAKGHGKRYGADVSAILIALRRDGLTVKQIAAKRSWGGVRLPSEDGIRYLRRTNPELKEAMDRARKDYEREIVEDGIARIPEISRVKGLKGVGKSRALAEHARVALQLGRQSLPASYAGDVEEREIIVMEVSGGWNPAAASASSGEDPDGQGRDAAAARDRWKRMRENGEDSDTGNPA